MKRRKSLTFDAVLWVALMVLAAATAFNLLQRDKQRHFGAVSFGSFPEFQLKTPQGVSFDRHQIKGYVWAVHAAASATDAMDMAKRLSTIEHMTASGKRHLNILTFSGSNSPALKQLMPFHYIVVGDQTEIASIFSSAGNLSDNSVLLVDQNGVMRGKYDFKSVDEYRSFQQDLLRLL